MPSTISPPFLITASTYRALPESGPRYQLIQGQLYMSPAPQYFHQYIVKNLVFILEGHIRRKHLGDLAPAPVDVYLTKHDVYQPDLVFVSQSRLSLIHKNGIHGAPDLVIEILSPGTKKLDLGPKREIYAKTGVNELWIVNPDKHEVAVYQLSVDQKKPSSIWKEGQSFTSKHFPGLEIPLSEVFYRGYEAQ